MDANGYRKLLTQIDRQRAQFAEPVPSLDATATGELKERLDEVKEKMREFSRMKRKR